MNGTLFSPSLLVGQKNGWSSQTIRDVLDPETEALAKQIVDAIYTVHCELGAGLLEDIYAESLCFELAARGLKVVRQKAVSVHYRGSRLKSNLRLDVLVNDRIIIEVKAVEAMLDVFQAQLFTYLKVTELRLGILVNFNVRLIKDGIKRVIR